MPQGKASKRAGRGARPRRLPSLKSQLALTLVLAVLPLVGILLTATVLEHRRHLAELHSDVERLRDLAESKQSQIFEGARHLLVALAAAPAVAARSPDCGAYLAALLRKYPEYLNLGAADAAGNVYCSALTLTSPVNIADRLYFRHAIERRDFAVGKYQVGRITGKPSLNFGYPITSGDGTAAGAVFVALDLAAINQTLGGLVFPERSVLLETDREGVVLAWLPGNKAWVGENISGSPLFAAMAGQNSGIAEAAWPDGIRRVFSFAPLAGSESGILQAVGIERGFALRATNRFMAIALGAVFLFAVLGILLGRFGIDRMVLLPIGDLSAAAERFRAGDMKASVPVPQPIAELDFFARLFNETVRDHGRQLAAIRRGEERLSLILRAVPIAIYTARPSGDYGATWMSAGAEAISGFPPERFVRDPGLWIARVHPDDRRAVDAALAALLKRGRFSHEYRWQAADGSWRWFADTAVLVRDARGKPKEILGTWLEVTERKKAELEISRSNEIRNRFIQIISHQLRTPLNSIRWNLESLIRGDFGPVRASQRGFMEDTYEANVSVIRRLGDILTAMDIEEGRIAVRRERISLGSLWSSVRGEFEKLCSVKGIRCSAPAPDPALPPVNADGEKIRTVMEKMIENAVAYTPPKGSIAVTLVGTDGGARFSVRDTGVGIPAAEQERVFTRFFRASNASRMLPDASGLSLFISKWFVEEHKGNIGFESAEGKGSTFWFELPAA